MRARGHRQLTLALVLVLAAALPACGSGLRLGLVQAAHQRPSNVAVFFTVDTSDDRPVPGLTAQDFRIYEDGSLVSVHESRQTIVNQQVAAEHYTLLLVDMSGSVTESDQAPLLDQAATAFTTQLSAYQRVAVYAFDGAEAIHPITPFSTGTASARAEARLAGFRSRDPSTNLHGAIVQGIAALQEAMDRSTVPLRFGTLVVFTDGTDHAARVSYDDMMHAIDDAQFDVFAIGIGDEIDDPMLADIGRSGYVRVESSSAIQQAFTDIGSRIYGYMQRYYLLSYCTPARAGTHEVTIEALHEGETGTLTYSFDASGFTPECDPNRPPPFDTSGHGSRRGSHAAAAHGRATVHVRASGAGAARGAGGGSGEGQQEDPELGDY